MDNRRWYDSASRTGFSASAVTAGTDSQDHFIAIFIIGGGGMIPLTFSQRNQ